MNALGHSLSQAFAVTGPIFIMMVLGYALRRGRLIDASFVDTATRLIFLITLPALLLVSILQSNLQVREQQPLIVYAVLSTGVLFISLWWASRGIRRPEQRGVFVQGAFRSNLGIVGIALCANAYGDEGVALGALLLAILTPFYNLFSVFALSASQPSNARPGRLLWEIIRNPLIVAIALGFALRGLGWSLPATALTIGEYFAQMTLPLALLCIGASLQLHGLIRVSPLAASASAIKLLLMPLLLTAGAVLIGFRGVELGTLFLMCASPSAAASYVMAKYYRGDEQLAADIIALTTLLCAFTTGIGLALLSGLGLLS